MSKTETKKTEGKKEMPRLQKHYNDVVKAALMKKFGYENPLQAPRLSKIVVNMGVGEAKSDQKIIKNAVNDLTAITGQKPVITKSKKAIAQFGIRVGLPIGCKVTLRRDQMWEFFDRLLTIALPRVRDFRGVPARSFDGAGNYAFGLKEQIVFPEIDYDKMDAVRGMDIIICTTAKTDEEAKELLNGFQMPFQR